MSSLVCLLHAGTASAIHFDFQAVSPVSFSPVVTIERWDIKLAGDRKQPPVSPFQLYVQSRLPQAGAILPPTVARKLPGTMSHHDRDRERGKSPELVSIAGLAFVQKVYLSWQAWFYGSSPAPATLAAGMGGAGGGDGDDGDDDSHIEKYGQELQPEFFVRVPDSLVQMCLKQKQRLLKILHKKMQWAQTCGNRNLVRILRDRIMLIEVDRDFLQQQTSYSVPSFRARIQEWLSGDSQKIQLYSQVTNDGSCQTSGNSFSGKRGRQATGSGGNGTASHHLTPAASDHNEDERERDDEPPPVKKAQPGSDASVACSRCQKTLHEQEVTRLLHGSTAESVTCDACLYSASQILPQETTGKRKATRKRTRPGEAAPEPKRGKSQPGKRKQGPGPQSRPAAKKVRLENPGTGPQPTPGTVEELETLERHLVFRMNGQEREAAKQLFEHLQHKKIKIKASLYKLLAKMGREELPTFCAKASVFFSSLTATIKDTGCLTSMLYSKKHCKDFAKREDSELEYLAGLDTLRAFSSMKNGKGLPRQTEVQAVLTWPEWKDEDGQFSMERFRAFSAMNHSKGLPEQTEVKAVLAWPEWKDESGQFSMRRFRAFSSMNSSRGLPGQAEVKAVLAWPEWKDKDGQFSMELFRAFSSMNNGKGLPEQAKVKAVLAWPEWKDESGQFSMQRFRAFSSMNSSRGLPGQAEVKAVLAWPEWKDENGQFSMERFRAFSSMNSSRGLPGQAEVKAVLAWPEWKGENGQFSMKRFRAFSSMNNGKGLPEQAEVKAVLSWPEWKDENGQFSMERFRAFSSMNNSRGLPGQAEVKVVLAWPEWKDEDGQFSIQRFRAFSSMNSSRGLPGQTEVKAVLAWPEWKDENGQFSMERFRAFSSMNHSKGLPKQTEVKAVLAWPEWKDENGQFSMERFRAFSSMNSSRGLPGQAEVKAVLAWPEWKDGNGQFSMARFRAFSSMNHGKGLPEQAEVKTVLAWLNCGKTVNDSLQRLMVRLYASEGVPDTKKLKQYEQKLSELFFANAVTRPESDDEDEQYYLIKSATLFLSTRKPQYFLSFENVERFYQQVTTGDAGYKLRQLITLLHSYGKAGVTGYLALNNSDRNALLSTCISRISLPLAMKAIHDFSPLERTRYLFFSRNLKVPPDKGKWDDIRLQLDRLASVLKTSYARRLYLEVIWSLAPSDRDLFLDETRAASVTALFPSLNALKNLANRHSRQWLKKLLEACLQYGQGASSRESIKRLFTALLETQLSMPGHGEIPDYFLSGYTALEDSAVFIPVTPPVQTTEELALHFVAAVTGVLSDMFYHYEANRLKVEQYSGKIHSFPVPELKIHDNGIEISNWSTRMFQHFLAVTEFPEHYYLSKDAWQKHCNPDPPGYFQRRMGTCQQRERTAPDAIAFQPFSIPLLMALLKNNIHINPTAWKSFDHHKDRLPRAVHDRLLREIEKAAYEVIPVSLREYLEAGRPPEEETLPQNQMAAPASTVSFHGMETLSEEEQFRKLWADLSRKGLVMVTDLELLAGYKEHMTMKNIADILKRTDAGMKPGRLYEFRQLLGEKIDRYSRQDPLLLELDDEIASYLIEFDM